MPHSLQGANNVFLWLGEIVSSHEVEHIARERKKPE